MAAVRRGGRESYSDSPQISDESRRGHGGALVRRSDLGRWQRQPRRRAADVITDHIGCPAHAYRRDNQPGSRLGRQSSCGDDLDGRRRRCLRELAFSLQSCGGGRSWWHDAVEGGVNDVMSSWSMTLPTATMSAPGKGKETRA
jgi:hypothetical protein